MSLKDDIMLAARADSIPAGSKGVWTVRKFETAKPLWCPRGKNGEGITLAAGSYTQLFCYTERAAMESAGFGEMVMHDYPQELAKHLDFMLRAHGRVLITGLGLGCVARGCLANPAVKEITVIERDNAVIDLVWPHMPQIINLVEADAVQWCKETNEQFDCAWHDLWTDDEKGEPHLQVVHSELLGAMLEKAKLQGAWEFPRWSRRLFKENGMQIV